MILLFLYIDVYTKVMQLELYNYYVHGYVQDGKWVTHAYLLDPLTQGEI